MIAAIQESVDGPWIAVPFDGQYATLPDGSTRLLTPVEQEEFDRNTLLRESQRVAAQTQAVPLFRAEAEAWNALVSVNPLDPPTAQLLGA
jgi:hypothetical protein